MPQPEVTPASYAFQIFADYHQFSLQDEDAERDERALLLDPGLKAFAIKGELVILISHFIMEMLPLTLANGGHLIQVQRIIASSSLES